MTAVVFFYDYGSPYSYLAATQLPHLEALGAAVERVPLSVLALQSRVGNAPTSMTCAPKRDYVAKDLARWAERYGVPLATNPTFSTTDFKALRRGSALASRLGDLQAYDAAIWPALWADRADLTDSERLRALLARSELDETRYRDDALQSVDGDLATNLDRAVASAAFGTPTFVAEHQIFFGNDRLFFLEDLLGRIGPAFVES